MQHCMVVIDCKPILSLVEITMRFFDWYEIVAAGIMGGLWLLIQRLVSTGLCGRVEENWRQQCDVILCFVL